MDETVRCAWCAEEILAAARKCRYCGEMVGTLPSPFEPEPEPVARATPVEPEPVSEEQQKFLDEIARQVREAEDDPHFGTVSAPKSTASAQAPLRKLSDVADMSKGIPACPKCGGTQFREQRSAMGIVVAGLLAPRSNVSCVTCGTKYKRG